MPTCHPTGQQAAPQELCITPLSTESSTSNTIRSVAGGEVENLQCEDRGGNSACGPAHPHALAAAEALLKGAQPRHEARVGADARAL